MTQQRILDRGYIELIETWGSDQAIVEAARMSTGKGFLGWDPGTCPVCNGAKGEEGDVEVWDERPRQERVSRTVLVLRGGTKHTERQFIPCSACGGTGEIRGDAALLRYLWKNNHATPFEFGGMIVEVKAPLMVYREWHRHRCLAGDSMIHFELPGGTRRGTRQIYRMPIAEIWRKWQPSVRRNRPERQENAFWSRSRLQGMQLRCVNEETGEIAFTRITDVIRSEPKELFRVTTIGGKTIRATLDHLFFTNKGWLRLEDAVAQGALLAIERTAREMALSWETPPVDESSERWRDVVGWEGLYEVSDAGRVRRVGHPPKRGTVGSAGYPVMNLNRPGIQQTRTVHSMVLEAWRGPRPTGQEGRHLNSNRVDARAVNLDWGTSLENSRDQALLDRTQRLNIGFEEIASLTKDGVEVTYDLSVDGPWHNFVADGIVVHNSQGYNEQSARYEPLPDDNYMPTVERCMMGGGHLTKQAGTARDAAALTTESTVEWLAELADVYDHAENVYQSGLRRGVPKELARLPVPVGRYSKMRATTNLRMWLAFATLRSSAKNPAAQWEIRMYADAVGRLLGAHFPRTWEIFAGVAGA